MLVDENELQFQVKQAITAAQKVKNKSDTLEVERTLQILKLLGSYEVSYQMLEKTQAGKQIKKMKKHISPQVAMQSSGVIDTWIKQLKNEKMNTQNTIESLSSGKLPFPAQIKPTDATTVTVSKKVEYINGGNGLKQVHQSTQIYTQKPGDDAVNKLDIKTQQVDKMIVDKSWEQKLEIIKTGDEKRDRRRDTLAKALDLASNDVEGGHPGEVASEIEAEAYKQLINPKDYGEKIRQLLFNLKDSKNPDLRARVLIGSIPPANLIVLGTEELASEQKRSQNSQIRSDMLKEDIRGQVAKASTDMFQCMKCKERKTTYYQMQTRSADEPMTTFVTCLHCNNRWKFC